MATEDAKQQPAVNPESEGFATNQKADAEVTTQRSSTSESANSDLASTNKKTIVGPAHQVALESTVAGDKKVSTKENTARSSKPNNSTTNQLAIKSSSGIASPRPTELNWNTGPIVAGATPSTTDLVSRKDVESSETEKSHSRDDLTRIEGVDKETQQAFYDAGYYRYRDIENANTYELKKVFAGRELKFSRTDFETWSVQASLCRLYQGDSSNGGTKPRVATGESLAQNKLNIKEESKSHATVNASTVGSTAKDDLTKIRGLGKASQEVLNKNNIYSFAQVGSMTSQQLDLLFSESPKRFQLVKTSTWPAQAKQFATAESNEEVSSQKLEAEILDEIDSIRKIATSAKTSSSAPRKKKQASKRD